MSVPYKVDVSVQYKQAPTQRRHQKVTIRGGPLKTTFAAINAGYDSMEGRQLAELAKDPTTVDHVAKPDPVAPGNHVASLMENGKDWSIQQNQVPSASFDKTLATTTTYKYLWLSETSMASRMVSGAAALMRQ